MAAITNPNNIPAPLRPHIKAVCQQIGPTLLGARYPKDAEGAPKLDLTTAEVAQVFEAVTREFWRQQVQGYRANEAAEKARLAAITEHSLDPFG